MRAAVVSNVRGKWEVKEVPTPEPGSNQVLMKIRASGLCYTDVYTTNGMLPTQFPRTLGREAVGEIVAVGSGVTTRQVGERVGVMSFQTSCGNCEWCMRGKPAFCSSRISTSLQMHGSHAEYMLTYADATLPLPHNLSYEQAAPIFGAGYTVWSGLRCAQPQPHERIAVVGIGGLGHLAVQYAKAAGFETFAVTHSQDKDKLVRELGADEVLPSSEALRKAGGADTILATSSSVRATVESLKALRPEGRLLLMGLPDEAMEFSRETIVETLIFNRGRIVGSQQNGKEYLYEALDYAAKGKVKAITEIYSLDEIGYAYERVKSGKVRFRAAIAT